MENNISERVLNILEWDAMLEELSSRCKTTLGRKVVASLQPLSVEDIKKQQGMITELKDMIIQGEIPDYNGITDIESLLNIAGKDGVLSLDELSQVKDFIIASRRIIKYISAHKDNFNLVAEAFGQLDKLTKLGDILIPSVTDNKELSDSKYPELKRIKNEIFSLKQEIEKKLNSMIHSSKMDKILQEKIYTIRNERYVILVKSDMKGRVKGTVHDLSSSGATIFIEPDEIIGLNNRLIMIKLDLQTEIHRILKSLSKEVGNFSDEIRSNLNKLAYLDFLTAAAYLSISIKGNRVEISDDFLIRLQNARHPLLYLMIPDSVIANDISLGEDYNCLIISGANTGGKTVLLKTIGLCALLAMFGLHLPADADSRIGRFSNILSDIGDDQSIQQSLSSYSGQIVILNEMIEKADKKSLILIDEIIASTDPRQGAVLSRAILENLILSEARIVVTTHYPELKELASIDKKFQNASVSFDSSTLKPTYRLNTGTPGASYAFEIATSYGIPEKIISRSKELLDSHEMTAEALIENIQKHRVKIAEDQKKIDQQNKDLSKEKNRYLEMQAKLRLKMEELKNEKGIKFLEELDKYRDDISKKIRESRDSNIKALSNLKQDIVEIKQEVSARIRKESTKRFLNKYAPFNPDNVETGDMVFIAPLEKEGKIESVDSSNKSALIILGNAMRTRYRFNDLLLSTTGKVGKDKPKNPQIKREQSDKEETVIPHTIQTRYNTIDLRGLRVEEALQRVEKDLDRMIRNGIDSAVVIHGHGTGALKEAVRNNLKHSFYVSDFRPGEQGEGGDGVSIVLLKG